jgi:hypothetical protein
MMTDKEQILKLFRTEGLDNSPVTPIFMPDLTTWYAWHSTKGTLPHMFSGKNMEDICRFLGVPIWNICKPWSIKSSEVEISYSENQEERITRYQFHDNTLIARWTKGPDGDWWQTEYPVKQAGDLDVIKAYLNGRIFNVETDELTALLDQTGNDGIVVPQLPSRVFSWLMLEILGWSEGLYVLMDAEDTVREIVNLGESQVQSFTRILVEKLHSKGCPIYLSPDNLDSMFISPGYFDDYLNAGYQKAAGICHENDSFLLVHGGGPLGGLLERISQCGIDSIAGISGPPQGDTLIDIARRKAGKRMVMWGGIPQDYLMESDSSGDFEEKTRDIIEACRKDGKSIIGIADHVPLEADMSRLKKIVDFVYG